MTAFILWPQTAKSSNPTLNVEPFIGQDLIDRYELYHPYRFTFVNIHERLFLLSLEANAFVELSEDGQVLREYVAESGSGPGDVTKPRIVLPYQDGFAILNYKNGQFVVLDKELQYKENFKTNFDAKRAFSQKGDLLVFLMGGRNILGTINPKTLQLERFTFPRRRSSNPMDVMNVALAGGHIFYYSPALTDDQNFPVINAYPHTTDIHKIKTEAPSMVLAGPELPELFKEGPRKGYRGYIANIVGYQNQIMVENVIADTRDEMRAFDIFNAQGQFQKRIVTHLAMIGSPMAEHVYILDTDTIYRLKGI